MSHFSPAGWTGVEREKLYGFWRERYHDQNMRPVPLMPEGARLDEGGFGFFDAKQAARETASDLHHSNPEHPVNQLYLKKQNALKAEWQRGDLANRERLTLQMDAERALHREWQMESNAPEVRFLGEKAVERHALLTEGQKNKAQESVERLIRYDLKNGHPLSDPDRNLHRHPPTPDERRQWLERDGTREIPARDEVQAAIGTLPDRWMTREMRDNNHYNRPVRTGHVAPREMVQSVESRRQNLSVRPVGEAPSQNKVPSLNFDTTKSLAARRERMAVPGKEEQPQHAWEARQDERRAVMARENAAKRELDREYAEHAAQFHEANMKRLEALEGPSAPAEKLTRIPPARATATPREVPPQAVNAQARPETAIARTIESDDHQGRHRDSTTNEAYRERMAQLSNPGGREDRLAGRTPPHVPNEAEVQRRSTRPYVNAFGFNDYIHTRAQELRSEEKLAQEKTPTSSPQEPLREPVARGRLQNADAATRNPAAAQPSFDMEGLKGRLQAQRFPANTANLASTGAIAPAMPTPDLPEHVLGLSR